MEIWQEIQPYVITILGNIAIVTTIWATRAKKSKKEKLEAKLDKAHVKTTKNEEKLKTAYQKEAALEKELQEVSK